MISVILDVTMKTAISIPDQIFSQAERFARQRQMTRSALFTAAVVEYLRQHREDDVTERLNRVHTEEDAADQVFARLQWQSLPKEEQW